jgi:hypothetical protein
LSQTVKANFRLIFRPPKDVEYRSKSTKSFIALNLDRINIIRGLCESYPYSVIAFLTSYFIKVWTKLNLEVFGGLIKLLKDKKEQDWLEKIVDIINKLETKRLISVKFRNLCGIINFTFFFSVLAD